MFTIVGFVLIVGVANVFGVAVDASKTTGAAPTPSPDLKFIHLSDMHLDIYSKPDIYSPAQFCRDPKDMPHETSVRRTWNFLQEDGIVPSHTPVFLMDKEIQEQELNNQLLKNGAQKFDKPYGWQLCDAFPAMVDGLMADAAKTLPNPDFLVLTGDWAAHLQLSLNGMLKSIEHGTKIIDKHFPKTNVIPVIGNNDVFPDYNATVCGAGQYVALYMQWKKWIPSSEAKNFVQFGGFQKQLHGGRLRVFSLNTVLYHVRNKAFKDVADPCGQMAWLRHELTVARTAGARVFITGHIPPVAIPTSPSQAGYFWWPFHQHPFVDMLHEFSDIISNSFWGHAHHDTFWTDVRPNTTIGGLMAPSITPLPPYPSYRIGTMTSSAFEVIDYSQHYLNLATANKAHKAVSTYEYNFAPTYGVSDLKTAKQLVQARANMLDNTTLSLKFNKYYLASYPDDEFSRICSTTSTITDYWRCRFVH